MNICRVLRCPCWKGMNNEQLARHALLGTDTEDNCIFKYVPVEEFEKLYEAERQRQMAEQVAIEAKLPKRMQETDGGAESHKKMRMD